ncbi:MAG: hypothetical protein KJ063_03380 [Anaerolineae bacterium]|nr:hypothetical protein [Anaerolineae bacterium]
MNTVTVIPSESMALIREGWNLLVEKLGIEKATQFVVLLERGKGDSVQEIHDYWGNANIEEIHQRVLAWKTEKPTNREITY